MAAGASAENFGHSARKSGGGRTVSRRRSSCGRWMVYDIVQGQENRPMSYRSRKIGIRQKSSGHRRDLCFLGRRLKFLQSCLGQGILSFMASVDPVELTQKEEKPHPKTNNYVHQSRKYKDAFTNAKRRDFAQLLNWTFSNGTNYYIHYSTT